MEIVTFDNKATLHGNGFQDLKWNDVMMTTLEFVNSFRLAQSRKRLARPYAMRL